MSLQYSRRGAMAPLAAVVLVALAGSLASGLTAKDVVCGMLTNQREQQARLPAYSALRVYELSYQGWGQKHASMAVRVEHADHGETHMTILTETGSGLLRHRVLESLLKAEQEDADLSAREGNALAPSNYSFRLLAVPQSTESSFVLGVTPRAGADQRRFLFRGRVWINSHDFGIESAQGRSARAPSFWVREVAFEYHASNRSGYWIPTSEHCVSKLRVWGQAVLDMNTREFHWRQ